jgi:apolipoprotein D and lipocalin family protein
MRAALCALLLALLTAGCAAPNRGEAPLQAVTDFDLERYLGKWYEIARYPNRFQRGCVATTAAYSRRPDGDIGVLNECRSERLDGPVRSVDGKAWVAEAGSAKLKVRFFWPFAANYWIVALDPQYQWALVGEPSRKYLWILSRTPTMGEELYAALLQRVRELGYDPGRVERTVQPTG